MTAKSIKCTRCGAPLELKSPRAKTIVCSHCGAQLDLTTPDYAFLEELRRDPLIHPLRVGMKGTFHGVAWEVIGHIRYQEMTWWWDEYLVMASDGRTGWIQYDEGSFRWFEPFVPQHVQPVDFHSQVLVADGRQEPVQERGRGRIDRIEGELTWKARVGEQVEYLDGWRIAVEITPRELEWFYVSPLRREQIAHVFGITLHQLEQGCYVVPDETLDFHDDEESSVGVASELPLGVRAGFVALAVFAFFCFFVMDECGDDDDDYYGGYGGGHYSSGGWSGGK